MTVRLPERSTIIGQYGRVVGIHQQIFWGYTVPDVGSDWVKVGLQHEFPVCHIRKVVKHHFRYTTLSKGIDHRIDVDFYFVT